MAACEFEVDKCGRAQEFIRELGESSATVSISNMHENSCTYKIEALGGAPGFNVDFTEFETRKQIFRDGARPEVNARPSVEETFHNEEAYNWQAYWIEWDSSANTFQDTTWLGLNVDFSTVECGTTCSPGDLVNREFRDGRNSVLVSGNMINSDIKNTRSRYATYEALAEAILELDELNGGGYNMPKYPKQKDDTMTFEDTNSLGGYGVPSGGSYELKLRQKSGYKPYGALGQGHKKNLGVTFGDKDQSAFMAVSIASVGLGTTQ